MKSKKVKDVMTPNPFIISPDSTLCDAAQKMKEFNFGILPVGTTNNVIGMISDRDIVVRGLVQKNDCNDLTVEDVMTNNVFSCDENDTLIEAADAMFEHKVGRLLVTNKDKRVIGILSFGGIVRKSHDRKLVSEVLIHATSKAA